MVPLPVYCINCSRLHVLPNAPPDIRNIFSEVLCSQSALVPQFWFLNGYSHLTLIEISFTNFLLSMQTVLQPEMFFFWIFSQDLHV